MRVDRAFEDDSSSANTKAFGTPQKGDRASKQTRMTSFGMHSLNRVSGTDASSMLRKISRKTSMNVGSKILSYKSSDTTLGSAIDISKLEFDFSCIQAMALN